MIKRSRFLKQYRSARVDVESRLREYIRDPNEEGVHRLRTAVRRFDSSAALLPASIRKENKQRRYRSKLKNLSKLNNRIRDIDVAIGILRASLPDPDTIAIEGRLRRERAELLGPALRAASSLRRQPPDIDSEKVRSRKLRKRYRKVGKEILRSVEDELKMAVGNPNDTDSLHALRIDIKNLRYTLELLPEDELGSAASRLEALQDLLGRIRDIDTTTSCLSGLDSARQLGSFVQQKRDERRQLYLRFVDSSKHSNLFELVNDLISS